MTGRPGIAFATRGPGATNASIGVHVARQDSRPMILFVGDVDRATRDREAFQEINFEAMFAPIAKWRSEEHTSELQSLMRISYAVFCLKKKKTEHKQINKIHKENIIHRQRKNETYKK